MTRRMPLLVGTLVLLLASSGVAEAVPILFNVSGQIRLGSGALETFEGSFILSDPAVTLFDPTDSRGDQRDVYTVSNFALSSASYSLTGAGVIGVWWGINRDDRGIFVNRLDSFVSLTTSAGILETDLGDFPPVWVGTPGAQPESFSGLTQALGPIGGRTGQIVNLTAVRARVAEPSTLLLMCAGIAGLALRRRRISH